MEKHVTLLAIAHLCIAGLNIVLGFVGLVFLAVIQKVIQEWVNAPPEASFVAWIVSVVPLFLILTALPGLIAGIGLLNRAPWARILAMIVGVFHLPNVPIGTALGVYGFWVLLDEEGAKLFAAA